MATCSSLVQLPRLTPATSVSNKTPPPLPKLSVRSLNATLEMDATPSYSSTWRGRDGSDGGGWRPGKSRLNVSATVAVVVGGSGSPSSSPSSSLSSSNNNNIAVSARLHPLPCLPDGVSMFGPMAYGASTAYRHGPTGEIGGGVNGGGGGRKTTRDQFDAEITGLTVKKQQKSGGGGGGNSSSSSSSQVSGSAEFPFLVDYDSAGSVVLYADAGTGLVNDDNSSADGVGGGGETSPSPPPPPIPIACCSLSPPPPDFPDEWSAVIEANVRDKGYTMVVRQLYSTSNQKVRLDVHSLGADRVVVQDYKRRTATFIDAPNSTHPRGSCDVASFDELDAAGGGGGGGGAGNGGGNGGAKTKDNVADDGSAPVAAGFSSSSSSSSSSKKKKSNDAATAAATSFLPTAAALAFAPGGGAARAKFVPSASFDVRGIPVETWHRRVDEPATNSSYDLLYFFPVNAWLASGEQYHRLLKAIVVNGTQAGQRVYQEFHFVDFRPYDGGKGDDGSGTRAKIPAEAFDPCEIVPGGAGCGCDDKNKSKKRDKAAASGAAAAASGGDFASFPASVSSAGAAPFDSGSGNGGNYYPVKGFLPSQVGSYVFFLFLGLVAGLLGVFGIPALASCCCSGRTRRARNFGRFDEGGGGGVGGGGGAPTSAVTSAA